MMIYLQNDFPFFFEEENEKPITITSERYIQLALAPFWEALGERKELEREWRWLQQSGATLHTARTSLTWLENDFSGGHVSNQTEMPWAPHSPADLSPLHFMLWGGEGAPEVQGIRSKPNTIFKNSIRKEQKQITVAMINRTIEIIRHVRLPMAMKRD